MQLDNNDDKDTSASTDKVLTSALRVKPLQTKHHYECYQCHQVWVIYYLSVLDIMGVGIVRVSFLHLEEGRKEIYRHINKLRTFSNDVIYKSNTSI